MITQGKSKLLYNSVARGVPYVPIMEKEVKVIFEPSGRTVHVLPGTVILEAAARAGFILQTPCGGTGKCGKCLVLIRHGLCPPSETDVATLGLERTTEGFRLACHSRIHAPLTIEIPDRSLFQSQQQILTADSGEPIDVHPRVRKLCVHLKPPSQHDTASDADRLLAALPPCQMTLDALRALPSTLRQSAFTVTGVLVDDELVSVEPGDTTPACYGIAVDIGSTTLVATLVDLNTGTDVAVAARVNPQTSFGDDVITRIQKCRSEKDGLACLQGAVIEGVNHLITELERKTHISANHIYEIVFAGNTTMQQVLCGINPSALGELPFVPAFRSAVESKASELRLHMAHHAKVYVFPQIGSFVGGDTVAGIIATRLDRAAKPSLLVDIGTNGEIVLASNGRLLATSVAAGPAFEGARILNGMRAAPGAIEKVILDGDVRLNIIGNTKPAGICGTGLIDAAAELLRVGILDTTGRLLAPAEAPADLPAALRDRLVEQNGEINFLLVPARESATKEPLFLYQRDIRELQLANAAIRAGINILLRTAGLQAADLDTILLAGAFGNFIRRNHARRIGMLPPIPCHRIRFVGNTASFGAKRALLSIEEKEYANRVARSTEHVDLSLDPEFQMEFGSAMLLPEHDLDECAD